MLTLQQIITSLYGNTTIIYMITHLFEHGCLSYIYTALNWLIVLSLLYDWQISLVILN